MCDNFFARVEKCKKCENALLQFLTINCVPMRFTQKLQFWIIETRNLGRNNDKSWKTAFLSNVLHKNSVNCKYSSWFFAIFAIFTYNCVQKMRFWLIENGDFLWYLLRFDKTQFSRLIGEKCEKFEKRNKYRTCLR